MSSKAPTLTVVWSARDAHEVFERAATVAAIRAVADDYPVEVGNSALLSELVDRELR